MVGRKKEAMYLTRCVESDHAVFLVVYGRRRVGKTYLIKEYFNDRFSFYNNSARKPHPTSVG